jgi:putative component of toxin-antitoxin plasmid stabilization module
MVFGNTSNVKWFAGIGEYVVDWDPGYRIYLAKDGESLISCCLAEGLSAASKPISSEAFACRVQGTPPCACLGTYK